MNYSNLFKSKFYEFDSYLANIVPKKGSVLVYKDDILMITKIAQIICKTTGKKEIRVKTISLMSRNTNPVRNPSFLSHRWRTYSSFVETLISYPPIHCSNENLDKQIREIKNYRKMTFQIPLKITTSNVYANLIGHYNNEFYSNIISGSLDNLATLEKCYGKHFDIQRVIFTQLDKVEQKIKMTAEQKKCRTSSFVITNARNDKGKDVTISLQKHFAKDYGLGKIGRKIDVETAQRLWSEYVAEVKENGIEKYLKPQRELVEYEDDELFK